ncbi:ATP-binding protein [Streptomyces canus]|uniref:ATP-binding protein n=1 Tax=Streptomyces canus TaxID=58343 RepID=UPI0038686CC2
MTDSCPPGPPKPYDRHDQVSYTPYPRSIPLARRHVAGLAVDWGQPDLAGDAALVASELCTNALLHGCLRDRLFRVETTLTNTALRIAVTDPRGERLPGTRPPHPDDQFGRGLLIVRTGGPLGGGEAHGRQDGVGGTGPTEAFSPQVITVAAASGMNMSLMADCMDCERRGRQ